MSYRHPRWYDYGKTDADLERENTGLMVLMLIGGPFTFGITWLALICLLVVDGIDARRRRRKFKK